MISQLQSRLAMVTVLLALQPTAFALELCIFLPDIEAKKWYTQVRQWIVPGGVAVVGVILASLAFAGLDDVLGTNNDQQRAGADVDADIAGDGVRIAVWAQISVLLII